jgi:hypothetical protein
VSGLGIVRRDGRPAGWTYYLVHDHALQVGAFVADSEAHGGAASTGFF